MLDSFTYSNINIQHLTSNIQKPNIQYPISDLQKHLLSKSTFIRGLQCSKSLYLYRNFINHRDPFSPEQKAIFGRGVNVGVLAQNLFAGGVDATPPKRSDNIAAVVKTKTLIDSGAEVIYEAAFQFEQTLVILDILVKRNNLWYAYEVKSSVKISNTYLLDASLQYYVITQSGIALHDFSIITMNNQYVKHGELELEKLFTATSVLKEVQRNRGMIQEKVQSLKTVALDAQMPDVAIGEQCFSPYNCDFRGLCWKNVPQNSILEINAVPKAELFSLYNKSYRMANDVPATNTLDKNANIHIQAAKTNKPIINAAAIKTFLDKVPYPLYFMDFETFMPAVPIFDNTKPYQHIPFQYSLHYKESKDVPLQHFSFLAEQGIDPRKSFIENLLKHTEKPGTILAYDTLMERNVLNALKKDFPQYIQAIDVLLNRMVDMMQPFQERSYYHSAMKNSFSIKNVLHALVPELNYKNLTISSGSIAMAAFEQLQTETDLFKIIQLREDLQEYCKLDTLAMVKIFEILEKVI